jgi:hypothetical protein
MMHPTCPYRLEVYSKNGIHYNSNQNSNRKALSAFPSSYLRMDIRREMTLLYTYYRPTKTGNQCGCSGGFLHIFDDLPKMQK